MALGLLLAAHKVYKANKLVKKIKAGAKATKEAAKQVNRQKTQKSIKKAQERSKYMETGKGGPVAGSSKPGTGVRPKLSKDPKTAAKQARNKSKQVVKKATASQKAKQRRAAATRTTTNSTDSLKGQRMSASKAVQARRSARNKRLLAAKKK